MNKEARDCPQGVALLGAYRDAMTVVKLPQTAILTGSAFVTPAAAQNAQVNLYRARREYWQHVSEHGCRIKRARAHSDFLNATCHDQSVNPKWPRATALVA